MTLDVCFSGSFSGILKQHNRERNSVVGFDLYLDIGNLSEGVFSDIRKNAVNALYNDPWLDGEDLFDEKYWREARRKLTRIKEHAQNNEAIRVWYSMDVSDMCGFMFIMSELRDIPCKLTGICLQACPDWLAYASSAWGQVHPDNIDHFYPYEREISTREKGLYADRWEKVCSQPWAYRTYLNGSVTGIPVDFFDNWLLSFVPEGEFQMRDVLGKAIGAVNGVPQYEFWHMRLTELLQTERFEVTRDFSRSENDRPLVYNMWFKSRVPVNPCIPPSWSDEILARYGDVDSEGQYIPNENIDAVLKAAREKYPDFYCDVVEHPHWGSLLEIYENKESKKFKHRFRVEED